MKKSLAIAAACLALAIGAMAQTAPQHSQGSLPHRQAPAPDRHAAATPADSAHQHAQGPIAHAQTSSLEEAADWLLAANADAQRQQPATARGEARRQPSTAHITRDAGGAFPYLFRHLDASELKSVGLSDAQIQQIEQIYQNNHDRLTQLNAEVQQRENDLRFLLESSQVDSAQAEQAADALIEARGRLSKATTMMMVQMRQVMGADQWFKLSELQQRLPPRNPIAHASVPPEPLPPGVFRPGRDGVTAPQLVSKIEPTYTEEARAAKISGSVVIFAVIGTDGVPRDIKILRSIDPGLDQKAMEAVSQWKFRPGRKAGQPVPVAASIEVTFRLM